MFQLISLITETYRLGKKCGKLMMETREWKLSFAFEDVICYLLGGM